MTFLMALKMVQALEPGAAFEANMIRFAMCELVATKVLGISEPLVARCTLVSTLPRTVVHYLMVSSNAVSVGTSKTKIGRSYWRPLLFLKALPQMLQLRFDRPAEATSDRVSSVLPRRSVLSGRPTALAML